MILLGAGGHAKSVVDALGRQVDGYIDDQPCGWLPEVPRLAEVPEGEAIALGVGGVTVEQLAHRLSLMGSHRAPRIYHRSAVISDLTWCEGSQVLAGAVVNRGAWLGRAVIVNTRAVVEHDAIIDDGTHIAPGAIVLGGVKVGACCMIGAGSVIVRDVPDRTLVKALTVWK